MLNGYQVYFWGTENILELDTNDGCTNCEYIKCHGIVQLKMVKMVNFICILSQ